MRYIFQIILLVYAALISQSCALTEITGGWSAAANGEGTSLGESTVSSCFGDPFVTLGITSTSSLYGIGSVFDQKTGSQSLQLPLGGYELSVAYDGTVSSSLSLTSSGSGSVTSKIGSTASGVSTGEGSYDLLGYADITTEGYLSGSGTGRASADGMAEYNVKAMGTPSEVWGSVSGMSSLNIVGLSSNSLVCTGQLNGLHTESRSVKDIKGKISSASNSWIYAEASVINEGKANVTSSGTAQGGAWESSFASIKQRLLNENAASSVTGELKGYAEANGYLDASHVSAILQAEAINDSSGMLISGGPASYAAVTQSSDATRTYAETWVQNSIWGSVSRTNNNQMVVHWGNLSDLGSGAHTYEAGSNALSFGKILMTTDYLFQTDQVSSLGNMSLDTYAEATNGKIALAGTLMGPDGDGTLRSSDEFMQNEAGFTGGLYHFSFVDAGRTPLPWVETHAILTRAYVSSNPSGSEMLYQPYKIDNLEDPNVAWSRTDGSYFQAH